MEITELTADDLSTAIHAKDVSCVEVMTAYLQRIERVNPTYNAIVSLQDGDGLLRQEATEAKGVTWSAADDEAFKAPIREQYEQQGHPYYATARLWDDGVIDPADTRMVLSLALAAGLNAPPPEPTRFGIFRM